MDYKKGVNSDSKKIRLKESDEELIKEAIEKLNKAFFL